MNRLRLIKTAYTALACLMLAACASDELTDGTVQDLPEGKYPLQISSVIMSAESTAEPWGADAPQTRVSEKTDGMSSVWTNGDIIGVKIDENTTTGEYSMAVANDNVTAITPVEGKAVYWHNKTSQTIYSWYPASGEVALDNQTNGLAYALYAKTADVVEFDQSASLTFTHKLAKIRVKFTGGSYGINKVEVYTYTSCKINLADGTLTDLGSVGYIPMCKTTYSDGTYWEANVVPGYEIKSVRLNGTIECKITKSVIPDAAKYYNMEIGVTGGTYYPDELPEITDDGEYTISGTGTKTITINGGSPKITLKDVTLTDAKINITGGSPTLIIQGTNTFTNGSISLSNSANVTIEGKNADNIDENVLKITKGSIASAYNATGGNIKIEKIKATITGANMTAGIGSGYGTCGNITINNSNIDVKGNSGGAAIGSGYDFCKCGNIEITNSDIIASGSNYYDDNSAAIGCGASGKDRPCSCKDITITLKEGQSKADFEAKLTASVYAEKVGLGGIENGTNAANLNGKVGTITWKRADGTVIETIEARN